MSVFQDLYDSEINFKVSTFWDGGFDVWLGDDMNGYLAETCVRTWDEVERWLIDAALKHYPNSKFAARFGSAQSDFGHRLVLRHMPPINPELTDGDGA